MSKKKCFEILNTINVYNNLPFLTTLIVSCLSGLVRFVVKFCAYVCSRPSLLGKDPLSDG